MFVLFAALLAGIVGGYILGGRLKNLDQLRVARPWLVLVALAIQLVAFTPIGSSARRPVIVALHLVSYALLVWFVVANRHRAGVVIAGAGMGLNLTAIAANGGHMPASPDALAAAGVAYAGETSNNSGVMHAGTHLAFLGDVFATPSWLPVANVFSVGDALIVAGVAVVIALTMRGQIRREAITA